MNFIFFKVLILDYKYSQKGLTISKITKYRHKQVFFHSPVPLGILERKHKTNTFLTVVSFI